MKKKLMVAIALFVCSFSFLFVGCAALDEDDKKLLNNACESMTEFVEDQKETNSELLNKIDELTEEITNLRKDKDYTQEEIKAKLSIAMTTAMTNAENFCLNLESKTYLNGKESYWSIQKLAYVYDEVDNNIKSMRYLKSETNESGIFKEEVYNSETKEYDAKYYDLSTGLEISVSDGLVLTTCFANYFYEFMNNGYNEINQFDDSYFELKVLGNNNLEFKIYYEKKTSVESGPIRGIYTFVFEDNKLKSIASNRVEGTEFDYHQEISIMTVDYLSELDMNDYIFEVE